MPTRIIDITHPLSAATAVWPGDPPVHVELISSEPTLVSRLTISTHAGTHVDAPRHRGAGRPGVDELDLHALCGPAQVVEPARVDRDEGAVAELGMLAPEVERVLIKTGFSPPSGFRSDGGIPDYVGITERLARELVARGVKLVGIDSPSVEPRGPAAAGAFRTHDRLLSAGVVLAENLALGAAREGMYILYCLPLRIEGADGAPARAVLVQGERG